MAKKKSANLLLKLTETEQDLLWYIQDGYQLETDSLGGNPVLRRLKDNEEVRPLSANRNTIKAMEGRRTHQPRQRSRPAHYRVASEKEAALVSAGHLTRPYPTIEPSVQAPNDPHTCPCDCWMPLGNRILFRQNRTERDARRDHGNISLRVRVFRAASLHVL